jgi:predicted nucleotidyltransferase component of viral defense system
MSRKDLKDVAASVRARLLRQAKESGEEFQATLSRYIRERLLYRLSVSQYRDQFILKGALLFAYWTGEPHRPTRDIDLLGWGEPNIAILEQIFREICQVEVEDDGVQFLEDSIAGERIKEDQEYEGIRIRMLALLAGARVTLQVDVGFGDAVVPAAEEIVFPSLLNLPAPRMRGYPRETVVAEKFQAMVALGILNSRMKDFYDLYILSQRFDFDGVTLGRAIQATFKRRKTPIPIELPLALTPAFYEDRQKQTQWGGFLRKGRLQTESPSLVRVIESLANFLMPPVRAIANGETFDQTWKAQGPWIKTSRNK